MFMVAQGLSCTGGLDYLIGKILGKPKDVTGEAALLFCGPAGEGQDIAKAAANAWTLATVYPNTILLSKGLLRGPGLFP